MNYRVHQWLSLRVRLLCIGVFVLSMLLPPYIPKPAFAQTDLSVRTSQFLLVEDGFLMKSSSLTRQGARRAYAEGIIHTVRDGDTIEHLAERYGISVDTIRFANTIEKDRIRPGDELLILPVDGILHRVSRGQSLLGIAELYDVPTEEIVLQNGLKSDLLLAGQELIIPGGKPIVVKPKQIAVKLPTQKPPTIREETAKAVAAPSVNAVASVGILQKPCNDCLYTQYYHPGHYAVDIQTKGGGPVFAAEDGIVIRSDYGWNGGYGNVIEVDHGNDLITLYAHNKEHYVEAGDHVARRQVIGWMGNTGLVYGSTGIHVHFEVRHKGIKKNPMPYLQ